MTRLRTFLSRDDEGFTLAELMVTMMLLGIITSITVAAAMQTSRTVVQESTRLDSLAIATVGMNDLTKTVRAGTEIQVLSAPNLPAFAAVGPESMTLYVNLGPIPSKVTYTVDGNRELIEQTTKANPSSGPYWTFSGTPTTITMARKIPTGSAQPLFTYYDGNGDVVAPTGSTDPTVLATIERVGISLTVQANGIANVPAVTLTNKVALPNLGIAER